ncbi:MAG: T9SS type A sorting domain-containing protein [Chitinophagaceae bacterium]|jgi:hypothetical protein|nr:T9SS type A sorting domain-containing protein [Chitinophagaceae bacterium]
MQIFNLYTGTVESSNPTVVNNNPVTVILKETPPSWIVAGTIASPLGWLPKSFVVKNSTFENTGRFGITAKTTNVVIDSSTFRFNGLAGVHLGSSFNSSFQEAQHAWNIVVKNSTFDNNIRRYIGNAEQGAVLVDQISVDNANINGNLYLFNNVFKDELYAYNLRDAMNIRLWGNSYLNVTTPIWRNLPTTSSFTQSIVFNDYVTDDLSRVAIQYSETWPTSSNPQDSLGTVTWNNNTGSFAEFHFVGNHISYYARRGSQMGMVDVYLDDVLVLDNFDLYSNIVQTKSLIYSNSNLQNTTHTLRIVNTGLKNASATANYVNIDFLMHRLGNYIVSPSQTGSLLPVNFLSFTGKADQNKIKLDWQTTNEINNSHFEVLKLDKNASFKTIGKVNAKNETSGINSYFHDDDTPNKGVNYYQLKQYDLDGKFSFSKMLTVHFDSKSTITLFPNPVKDRLYIAGMPQGNNTIELFSITGARVKTISVNNTNHVMQLSEIPSGKYVIKITNEGSSLLSTILTK